MINRARLGLRLVNALEGSGIKEDVIEQLCRTLEIGNRIQLGETPQPRQERENFNENTEVDWDHFPQKSRNVFRMWRLRTLGILQMLSEENLSWLDDIGPAKIDQLLEYLSGFGLRFRERDEPLVDRAQEVYGGIEKVPSFVAVNIIWRPSYMNLLQCHVVMERNGWLTLGNFNAVTERELHKHLALAFQGSGFSRGEVQNIFIRWLRDHGISPLS